MRKAFATKDELYEYASIKLGPDVDIDLNDVAWNLYCTDPDTYVERSIKAMSAFHNKNSEDARSLCVLLLLCNEYSVAPTLTCSVEALRKAWENIGDGCSLRQPSTELLIKLTDGRGYAGFNAVHSPFTYNYFGTTDKVLSMVPLTTHDVPFTSSRDMIAYWKVFVPVVPHEKIEPATVIASKRTWDAPRIV